MAFGFIKVLPASTHTELALSGMGGGNQYPSVKILNPNDGVVYVARNRDCLGVDFGAWDWKVPSQSYAILPGPFSGVGLFYLDQSGAGRQGEITVYASQQKVEDPAFIAVGRALQAQSTTLDIVEGVQPGNPGVGIARLWADAADFLHVLNASGVSATVIDNLTGLGGVLSGTLPNPGMAAGVAATNIGALGGDLTGTLPNPVVGPGAIGTSKLAANAATILQYAADAIISWSSTTLNTWLFPGGALSSGPVACLGTPVMAIAKIAIQSSVTGINYAGLSLDGGGPPAFTFWQSAAVNSWVPLTLIQMFTPSAGNHSFAVTVQNAQGSGTLALSGGEYSSLYVVEFRR